MKVPGPVKIVASLFAGLVLTPFLQTPAAKLAEHLHFDTYLSDQWEPLMHRLSDLAHNLWYVFFAGTAVGIAIGIWLSALFPDKQKPQINGKRTLKLSEIEGGKAETFLRLDFQGGQQAPIEIISKNILYWYTIWSGRVTIDGMMRPDGKEATFVAPSTWVIYICFDEPVKLKQFILKPASENFPRWEIKQQNIFAVIITTFGDDPPRGIVDFYAP